MRIICISDTHELHREVAVPPGDLLIHAGDFTWFSRRMSMICDFNAWLGELPHRHKIVIPGNHEFAFEEDPALRDQITNATLLVNELTEIEGLKIWGSPITPLYGGAVGLSSAKDQARLYASIPDDIELLITHTPPFGILDQESPSPGHSGCEQLREAVEGIRPRVHVFGHTHGGYG